MVEGRSAVAAGGIGVAGVADAVVVAEEEGRQSEVAGGQTVGIAELGWEREEHGTVAAAGVEAEVGEPGRSYVPDQSAGSDVAVVAEVGPGIAGIGTEVGDGTVAVVAAVEVGQGWMGQSSVHNFAGDGEVVGGTEAVPRRELQLGTIAAARTADVAGRTDRPCVD